MISVPILSWLKRLRYTLTFVGLFLLWLWLRPEAPAQIYRLDGQTMGTTYQILITGFPDTISGNQLADTIGQKLQRLDKELMSTYAPESELSQFNQSEPGQWFKVSPELAYVVDQALVYSRLTQGYFDITVGPLVNRWGFGPLVGQRVDHSRIPSAEEISQLQQQIGFEHIQVSLNPPQLYKDAPVYLDLSGIAKGYAVDVVAEYFDSLAMPSYFIEIGGELRIKGLKPDGAGWVPAIEKPVDSATPEVIQIFYSQGESLAVAGSGDYRNYFEDNGVRYSHEIDPFTGWPAAHTLAAVTVIADTALQADALATAFMVMGEEKSMALATELNLAVYFISKQDEADNFRETYTTRFAGYLEE
jgi:FAD:protein FMN transferase